MGRRNKKGKKAKEKDSKEKEPKPYTKKERLMKVNAVKIQLINLNMFTYVPTEIKQRLDDFVEQGIDYCDEVDIPEFSRVLSMHFVNDRNMHTKNGIVIKFKKVRVEDVEDHPINILNKAQEEMFDNSYRT